MIERERVSSPNEYGRKKIPRELYLIESVSSSMTEEKKNNVRIIIGFLSLSIPLFYFSL